MKNELKNSVEVDNSMVENLSILDKSLLRFEGSLSELNYLMTGLSNISNKLLPRVIRPTEEITSLEETVLVDGSLNRLIEINQRLDLYIDHLRVLVSELSTNIIMNPTYPIIGRYYHHYKGGNYLVESISTHTETKEILVNYKSVEFGTNWSRPLDSWIENVNQLEGIQRFKLIQKDEESNYVNLQISPEEFRKMIHYINNPNRPNEELVNALVNYNKSNFKS